MWPRRSGGSGRSGALAIPSPAAARAGCAWRSPPGIEGLRTASRAGSLSAGHGPPGIDGATDVVAGDVSVGDLPDPPTEHRREHAPAPEPFLEVPAAQAEWPGVDVEDVGLDVGWIDRPGGELG